MGLGKNIEMFIELKCEIIEKMSKKELIKGIMPAKGITIIPKLRTYLYEEMAKQLMVWVTEKQPQSFKEKL